jgi:GMP synthase (glutamine-hydrolysing)
MPRFLVVDGYTSDGRKVLREGGASEGGALYAAMLERHCPDAGCDIVYPADANGALPAGAELKGYAGVCWTGSSLTIYHDVPEVTRQIALARTVFESGVPSFGSCWAAQIAAVAAGGAAQANRHGRETSIARKIALTPEGRAHPMFAGKASVFDAFTSHFDEVTHLPPDAQILAANAFTRIQALSVNHGRGSFWAVQYHPEYDLHELARLTFCRLDMLVKLGFFADREAGQAYVDSLEALHRDPGRQDLAWQLGLDQDVLSPEIREREVANWLAHQVLPRQ